MMVALIKIVFIYYFNLGYLANDHGISDIYFLSRLIVPIEEALFISENSNPQDTFAWTINFDIFLHTLPILIPFSSKVQ